MAIYVFKMLVGYLPNGVENAMGYRAKMLKDASDSVKYIFTEVPLQRYIDRYKKVGIPIHQMLSAHQYFTDNHTLEVSGKVSDKLADLKWSLGYTDIVHQGNEIKLLKDGWVIAIVLINEDRDGCFHSIHYYNRGKLLRTEVYTDGISYANYYVTAVSEDGSYARLVRRSFYNRDGSVAYEQLFEGKEEWYAFPDGRLCTKVEFMAEFVKKLNLEEQDTVLMDFAGTFAYDFLQPLFQYGNKARFICVLHSVHFYEKDMNPDGLYLNWEYYYWFKYSKMIDSMVVSTEEQKRELAEKLRVYKCAVPRILAIPAGGLDFLRWPEKARRSYSLLTVSRLHKQKKIDWIIKSVIRAHIKNPDITLDIYGCDEGELQYLQGMVVQNGAQGFVRFMGHVDVSEIYKNYEVYISASLMESLGLSLMEAVGSGNAVIGLDVKYGNRLFIRPEENGYLIDFHQDYLGGDDEPLIEDISEKIIKIFEDRERLEEFHRRSYEIARNFMQEIIAEKWNRLLGISAD